MAGSARTLRRSGGTGTDWCSSKSKSQRELGEIAQVGPRDSTRVEILTWVRGERRAALLLALVESPREGWAAYRLTTITAPLRAGSDNEREFRLPRMLER